MNIGLLLGQGQTAEVFAYGKTQIVKLFKEGYPADLIKKEFLVTQQAFASGLPVPALSEPVEVNGRTGLVFERIDGQTITNLLANNPHNFVIYAKMMAHLHLAIHYHRVPALPFFLGRLEQAISKQKNKGSETAETLVAELYIMADGVFLCHGDFHPDNIIIADRGPVVIDWGNSGRGNPAADAGTTSLGLKVGKIPSNAPHKEVIEAYRLKFQEAYLQEYLAGSQVPHSEISAWEAFIRQFLPKHGNRV